MLQNYAYEHNHKGGCKVATRLDSSSPRNWHNQAEEPQGTNKYDKNQAQPLDPFPH